MKKGPKPREHTVRFYESFMPDLNSGCWIWEKAYQTSGYGIFSPARCKTEGAHRASWRIHNGPIPKGMHVLHKCNFKPCVNPSHLKIGSHAENMADARKDGLVTVHKKLTDDQFKEIKSLKGKGVDIAKRFGISDSYVSQIRHNKSKRRAA